MTRHWEELEHMFNEKNIPADDIRLVRLFFSGLPFTRRQHLFGIFLGWPEEAPFFVKLLRKKKAAVSSKNDELLKEVLKTEKKYLDNLSEKL